MQVFLVLVEGVLYAVADTKMEKYPVAVVKVPPNKSFSKPVMTPNDFLTMAAKHKVFSQVTDWDPLWQSANDT